MATHQLNYPTYQLENLQLPSEATALKFQCWDVSSCNTLFQGQNWSFQQDSAPNTQGTDNPAVAGDKCSGLHLHLRLAFCKSRPKPLGLQIVVQSFRRWLASRNIPILKECVCVCSNANPLHYYALQIPRKVDRWH